MRIYIALVAAVAFVAQAGAARAATTLAGPMASFNYLMGSWNCTTKLPAMMGQPAHTEQASLTFEGVPGNVLHDHVSSAEYSGDDYFGYNDKMKTYWSASADNSGVHGAATSTDGKTYTGTSTLGAVTMNGVSTYTKVSDSNIAFHEVISGGGQQATIDSACTR